MRKEKLIMPKNEKMTYADACLTLQAIKERIPSDAADVQIILRDDLENMLQCTEAPVTEAFSVIWGDGHLHGVAAAMSANRIPPLDDDKLYSKMHAALHEIMARFLANCFMGGAEDADN